jgi:nucleotide-binding universal stress UspA family protein
MFGTILVATDGSNTADRAVATAHSIAHESSSRVVLAHVNELMAGRGGLHPVHPNEELLQLTIRLQVCELKASELDAEVS